MLRIKRMGDWRIPRIFLNIQLVEEIRKTADDMGKPILK
jgi:hypothetical protein